MIPLYIYMYIYIYINICLSLLLLKLLLWLFYYYYQYYDYHCFIVINIVIIINIIIIHYDDFDYYSYIYIYIISHIIIPYINRPNLCPRPWNHPAAWLVQPGPHVETSSGAAVSAPACEGGCLGPLGPWKKMKNPRWSHLRMGNNDI